MMRIDPHVHFRDAEESYKETISHGLLLAKEQGVGMVFDMPNTKYPILTLEDVQKRLKIVPVGMQSAYRLYIGATAEESQLKGAVSAMKANKAIIGIKMFAGKSVGDLALDAIGQKEVYAILAKLGYAGVLAVHCEKESEVKALFNPEDPITHAYSRPSRSEVESIKDQISFAGDAGFKGILHICHVSAGGSIEMIAKGKKSLRMTCGVTPHHILWDQDKLERGFGLIYKTNPPLREKRDVMLMRKALVEGRIDWIESDHAPHALGEKLFGPYPSGFPSLYLYRGFVESFLPGLGLSSGQIEDLTFNNISKAFGVRL